jgi:ATP-binding cassette subfamily B protein
VLIKLVRPYLRPYRRLLVVLLCLQMLQSLSTLFLPTINANIIDKGVLKGDTNYIWTLGGLMLLITLFQVLFAIGAVFCGARVAMSFGRDVRRDLFHKVTGFSAREVGEFGAPSLITRITNDVQQVQMLVLMGCIFLVVAPITIVGGTILAINEDGPLSMILLVAIPLLALSIGTVYRKMHPQFMLMQIRIDRVNQILREQITGIRVVRAFVRERAEKNRFEHANDALTDTSLRTGRLMAFMFPTVMLTVNLSSAAAVWFGANRINAGQMQVGALIAYISYLIQILMAVMMGTFVIGMAPRAAVCADRIEAVLSTESSVKVADDPVTELPRPASLEFRNAAFSFAGAEKAVLTDISFRVRAGETLAIIGSTGSGKTALLNLIVRLFDVTDGQVLIDGINVREIDPDTLHRAVGLVPQKPYLFSGTVGSNVRFGEPDADEAAVWRALEIAQARDFVAAMPGGLSARIAQGGSNVSGGQRQRLAIARALAHRPDIYLFDDSFSALDLATDARLRAALAPVVTDAVNVIVAQRVSTIVQADQILVLEQGRQVGLGTHDELIEGCPTYQEIVESQFVAQAEELGIGIDDRPAPSAGVSSP